MKPFFCLLAAAIVLSACSSSEGPGAAQTSLAAVKALLTKSEPRPNLRTTLTPDVLDAIGEPVLLVELTDLGVQAGVLLAQETGSRQIWASQNNITLTLLDGILAETRGLGNDLMSADLSDVRAALRGRTKRAVRVHYYLNGEDVLEPRAFVCDYRQTGVETIQILAGTYQTTQVSETCTGPDQTLQNTYWIDSRGIIQKSRQWVAPITGYMEIERASD
ncbi:YjbF family lipoprotein [Puniceibacterium sp. IMCC21224]|uniref:YjbF family lipoprotein n=1 Tax=Puniceibacterium sp. IMCC21224 TaxID=1618204 RepID=UPI00064DC2ED|nr:YjbF family lipoprotein [Puniceibacterium sp. IMCC21224]KMK68026.1 Group 4 capsule polysaccharide formation lipoprotein gfcB [Puniceibacterium sp. IMCC21224]